MCINNVYMYHVYNMFSTIYEHIPHLTNARLASLLLADCSTLRKNAVPPHGERLGVRDPSNTGR